MLARREAVVEGGVTVFVAASERPASLVSCSVRNETTPVSAHKNRKFATTENLTLRAERASFIASHAVARGLSSRSASSSLSVTEGVMWCSSIQAFTLLRFSRRASTICSTTLGIASSGRNRNTSRQVAAARTAPPPSLRFRPCFSSPDLRADRTELPPQRRRNHPDPTPRTTSLLYPGTLARSNRLLVTKCRKTSRAHGALLYIGGRIRVAGR